MKEELNHTFKAILKLNSVTTIYERAPHSSPMRLEVLYKWFKKVPTRLEVGIHRKEEEHFLAKETVKIVLRVAQIRVKNHPMQFGGPPEQFFELLRRLMGMCATTKNSCDLIFQYITQSQWQQHQHHHKVRQLNSFSHNRPSRTSFLIF